MLPTFQALPLIFFCAAAFPVIVYIVSRLSDLEVTIVLLSSLLFSR